VNEYLNRTIHNPTKVDKIQAFLQDHWLMQSLVRIPIQLDALCYTWEEEIDLDVDTSQTMTAIYTTIELKLWKKDIARLKIRTQHQIQKSRSESEIIRLVAPERQMLEAIAFSGLHSDMMDFDWKYRDKVYEKLKVGSPTTELSWDDTLERLSFLRTSDPSAGNKNPSYHFLHLTFQEYFAARYFVRKWLSQEQLDYIDPGKRTVANTQPDSFLRKHKYKGHYDVFWRFVAGLLDAEDKASSLFEMIESEPRDLLGPTHQRLVMHCLSEVSSEMPMRPHLEQKMVGLPALEIQSDKLKEFFTHIPALRIVNEMEFPRLALDAAFQQGTQYVKLAIMKGLEAHPRVPLAFMEDVIECLRGEDPNIREVAFDFLCSCKLPLSSKIFEALNALCESEDIDIQTAAICILVRRSTNHSEALKAIDTLTTSKHYNWLPQMDRVFHALSRRPILSDKILNMAVACLSHSFIFSAEQVLLAHSPLSYEILKSLETMLFEGSDEDEGLKRKIVKILQAQPSLPDDIQKAALARLDHKDIMIRLASIEILYRQWASLSDVTDILVALVNDKDPKVQDETIMGLRYLTQITLPDNILESLLVVAQGKVRNAVAIKNLSNQPTELAIQILQFQPALPHDMIDAMVAQLKDKDPVIRETAVTVLAKHLASSEEVPSAVVACFRDTDSSVKRAVTQLLESTGKLTLSDEIIIDAAACLSDADESIQWWAINVLRRISKPIPLNCKVALSKDKNSTARQVAVHDLKAVSEFTPYENIMKAIPRLLKSRNSGLKYGALETLKAINASNIPHEVLKLVISILLDSESSVGDSLEILHCQKNLPGWALQAVASLFETFQAAQYRFEIEGLLRKHAAFYGTLLGGTYAAALYEILLARSFGGQFSLYIEDGALCIDAPEGCTRIIGLNLQEFMNTIETRRAQIEARPATRWDSMKLGEV
jgi:hypothetical protein